MHFLLVAFRRRHNDVSDALLVSGTIVVFILGWVLQLSGFVANQIQQPPATELAIRLMLGWLPFLAYLIGATVFTRYRLSEAKHADVRRMLNGE